MFKVKMPDVAATVGTVPNVKLQVRDGGTIVTEASLILQRISGTDFFRTASPLSLEIPTPKQYTVFLKQQKSIRRSFTVTLAKGRLPTAQRMRGRNVRQPWHIASGTLFSGDSEGSRRIPGTTRSDSYNKIDAGDASRMIEGYKANPLPPEPNADFNLDRKIDIFDLAILGKNYGKKENEKHNRYGKIRTHLSRFFRSPVCSSFSSITARCGPLKAARPGRRSCFLLR
jgi:hypothetical protein